MRRDILLCLAIFAIALLLRLPCISYPNDIVMDEGYFATFIQYTLKGQAFFEGHPPAGWLLPSLFVRGDEVALWNKDFSTAGSLFQNFPYVRLRIINAISGSLLAVLFFVILRYSGISRGISFLMGILAGIDNALITFSRVMLPQIDLVLFGLLGVFLIIFSSHFKEKFGEKQRLVFLIMGSLFLGLSVSIKLTGLGFVFPALFFLIINRSYKYLAVSMFTVLIVYAAVFAAYVQKFTPGRTNPELGFIKTADVSQLQFPEHGNILEFGSFLFEYNKDILIFHDEYGKYLKQFAEPHPAQYDAFNPGSPWLWPISANPYVMWNLGQDRGDNRILIKGNQVIWILGLAGVLYGIFKLGHSFCKEKYAAFFKNKLLLVFILGYLVNYVPFFFIPRPMFLYSYFSALAFALILLGYMLMDLKNKVRPRLFILFTAVILGGSITYSIVTARFIYGF